MHCLLFNFNFVTFSFILLQRGATGAPLPDPDKADVKSTAIPPTDNFPQSRSDSENYEETPETKAQAFLFRYGYLSGKSKNSFSSSTSSEMREALKKLQKFAGLEVTGEIDESTLSLMDTPRCQLPDTAAVRGLTKRFVSGGRWDTNELTYDIGTHPTKSFNLQNQTLVDEILETSFKDWCDVSSLIIKRSSNNPKITINFYSRDHGDGYPFDGSGRVLAHAFFPDYGFLHFDNDEPWSPTNYGGPNLRQVATHEIGHVLGLDHTNVRGAVMFPYYAFSYNFKLHDDDVNGIVSLYGPHKSTLAPTMLKNPPTSSSTSSTTSETTTTRTTTFMPTTPTTTTTPTPTTSTTLPPTSSTPTAATTTKAASTTKETSFLYFWQWRRQEAGDGQ